MAHNSSTVCSFLDHIIPELKSLKPNLRCVHYWTDSPSSQYRNRYIFHTVANHQVLYSTKARWNFFEVGHGKGPCDGLGGTTKRMADMAIRQGHVQIQNAEDFHQWGLQSGISAKFLYVSSEETKRKHAEMSVIRTKPLKGTMKLHAVGVSDDIDIILTRETSCYCQLCISGAFCNSWKKEQFKCITITETNVEVRSECTDTRSNTENESTARPDDDSARGQPTVNDATLHMKHIDVGTMVAAVYDDAWYIGEVLEKDEEEGEYEIKFMEKAEALFKWPHTEDRLWVNAAMILCVVDTLQASGKSKRLFMIQSDERDMINGLFKSLHT